MTDLLKKKETKYVIVFIWLLVSLFLLTYIGVYAIDYLRIGIVYMLHVGAISTYLMKRWLRNEKEIETIRNQKTDEKEKEEWLKMISQKKKI